MRSKMNLAEMILRMGGAFAVIFAMAAAGHASAVRPAPISLSFNGGILGGFYPTVTPGGTVMVPNGAYLSDLSPDGNLVAFISTNSADNFVPGAVESPTSNTPDVFVRNIRTGETVCASCQYVSGFLTASFGQNARISANGRYVVFEGFDLLNPSGSFQVFRYDLQTGSSEIVSVSTTAGVSGDGSSVLPVISDDGRYVAFQSFAPNLVAGYPPVSSRQLFVRDMQAGETFLASHAAGSNSMPGNQEIDYTQPISISGNGRFVAWTSKASNYLIFTTDTNNATDVFFYDVFSSSGSLNIGLASHNFGITSTGNGASYGGIVSADSTSFPPTIVFSSNAANLNSADLNGNPDVYCYKGENSVRLISVSRDGVSGGNDSLPSYAAISRNGRYVAFTSRAPNLVNGIDEPTATTPDVFLRDLQTNTTSYVSLNATGMPSTTTSGASLAVSAFPNSGSYLNRRISDDGRFVAFSTSEPLSVRDTAGTYDIYVRDMTAGVSILATLNTTASGGQGANSTVYSDVGLTANGRKAVFTTGSVFLFPGDTTTAQNTKVFQSNISLLAERSMSDVNGDGKNDYAVFRPSEGNWYALFDAAGGGYSSIFFGENGNRLAPGDYDGDGKTDYAVFNPALGRWDILQSSNNSLVTKFFGTASDMITPADFDGDGKTDLAYFRPSNATWFILLSNTNSLRSVKFGLSGDLPTVGDFDGDNRADIALFRPSSGDWWIWRSSDNGFYSFHWGISTDKPVCGDFDGDGRTDAAVFRDGTWFILNSRDNSYRIIQWGLSSDRVVAADYDGDGQTDPAVFRPSTGVWYVLRSSDNSFSAVQWGVSGDLPVPAAYLP